MMWRLLVVVLLAVTAGAAAFWGMSRLREPYKGFAGDEAFVEIPAGAGRTRSNSGWSRPAWCAMR